MTVMARASEGAPIPVLRPGTVQNAAYTVTAGTVSNAVGANTTVVRVYCTTAAHVAIGSAPTATTSDTPVAAATAEYFRVIPGSDKVSAVQQAAGGTLYVTEMI